MLYYIGLSYDEKRAVNLVEKLLEGDVVEGCTVGREDNEPPASTGNGGETPTLGRGKRMQGQRHVRPASVLDLLPETSRFALGPGRK